MNTQQAIAIARKTIEGLHGQTFDLLSLGRPLSLAYAADLAKIISKLSPMIGNLLEFSTVEKLNTISALQPYGKWIRQDPGFPDALFEGRISPAPGFEIKAWFPLATEITARFKDSQTRFLHDEIHVILLAWLPSNLIYGTPTILDACVISGRSVAKARDDHYHKPPDYLVLEPGDTSDRTGNLQQSNTSGYKWQDSGDKLEVAEKLVSGWGLNGTAYQPSPKYQRRLRTLTSRFDYRLDTNFAKMDRIQHEGIEGFKSKVLASTFSGRTVKEWSRLFAKPDGAPFREAMQDLLGLDS